MHKIILAGALAGVTFSRLSFRRAHLRIEGAYRSARAERIAFPRDQLARRRHGSMTASVVCESRRQRLSSRRRSARYRWPLPIAF